ncbi:hypothetical protein Tco_0654665 [Tanacetum coccineum]|uniref:Uncharacterized protein n=1 Tax=Tanacetum coccineum TaxID=301880 RepID=A0ABQ4X4V1_9ASTR
MVLSPAEIDDLKERMRLWFRGEVPEIEGLRSMAVRCRTRVAGRAAANQREDLHVVGMVNAFVARLCEGSLLALVDSVGLTGAAAIRRVAEP